MTVDIEMECGEEYVEGKILCPTFSVAPLPMVILEAFW
jgi:hypothetical protein